MNSKTCIALCLSFAILMLMIVLYAFYGSWNRMADFYQSNLPSCEQVNGYDHACKQENCEASEKQRVEHKRPEVKCMYNSCTNQSHLD